MKNLLGILFLVLFSVMFCVAEPPPEEKVYQPEATFVTAADNVVSCTINTAYVMHDYTELYPALHGKVFSFVSEALGKGTVWEVAFVQKISLPKAESGLATKNVIKAINFTCYDNAFINSLCDNRTKRIEKNTYYQFKTNYQNSNFGYPLSAN